MADNDSIRAFSFERLDQSGEHRSIVNTTVFEPKFGHGSLAVEVETVSEPSDPLEEAKREAAEILARARVEAEIIREAARREGIEEGAAEGRNRFDEGLAELEGLMGELAGARPKLLGDARDEVVGLAVAIAENILTPLAAQEVERVVAVVERSIGLMTERESLTIRVHPDRMRVLVDAKSDLLASFDGIKRLMVIEDPSVAVGGCIVEADTTQIDGRLDTQFKQIVKAVMKA